MCASVRQRLNKAMQPGDPAERVRVPAPGCRGPAQRGGLENRTRRGKGRRTERVPRSRQVPGVQPVCRFLVGTHGRSRSALVRRTETAPRMGRRSKTSASFPSPRPGQGRSLAGARPEEEATSCPLSVPATEGRSPEVSPRATVKGVMTDDARPGNVPARRASAAAAPAARPALRRPRPPLLSPPLPPRGTARPAPRAVVTCSARASPRPLGPAPAPPGDRRAARRARKARC